MSELKQEYLEVLEKNDWKVIDYVDNGRVEIAKFSPAGEDFSICVEVENFPRSVEEYAYNFDVDEHIEMWVEAKKNGGKGIPSIRRLVQDAEDIDTMLTELAEELSTAEQKMREAAEANERKLIDNAEAAYKKFEKQMLKKTRRDIFDSAEEIDARCNIYRYLLDAGVYDLATDEIKMLVDLGDEIIDELYVYYENLENPLILNHSDITEWVKGYCKRRAKGEV